VCLTLSDSVAPVSFDSCRISVALSLLTVTDAAQDALGCGVYWRTPPALNRTQNDLEVHLRTEGSRMRNAVVQILVVDDYEPFRRFLYLKLQSRPELQIIGEASDGLQAVQKAEELQPDLILLDIGLPKLNGIEAARQIRKSAPQARIIFVSQESSPDMVQEAVSLGTCGYVVKSKAERDLLVTVDAVLEGSQFLNGALTGAIY
jgi:CheY-like chemotaxis protein